jgi:rhodanese-related sulfurtransferase
MDPRTVADRRGELQILDVREDEEWAAGHIDGAVHIPLGQLPQRIGELDPQVPSSRSAAAAAAPGGPRTC